MKKGALVAIGVLAVLGLVCGFSWRAGYHSGQTAWRSDTVRVTKVDTVTYFQPVPKDSTVVRYVTKVLPCSLPGRNRPGMEADAALAGQATDESGQQTAGAVVTAGSDSVEVVIPITQKKYETEDYRAYVSGYEPNLDSIFVYRRTVTEQITQTIKPRSTLKDRIGFSLIGGGGYGLIHRQADLFVGAGVTVRIWP